MTTIYPTGAIQDVADDRDILFSSVKPPAFAPILPRKFSRRSEMGAVTLQFYGSCVGFTGRDIANSRTGKQTSGKFAYGECKANDGLGGEGTYPRILMKVLTGIGICLESTVPNDPQTSHAEYIDTSKYPPQAVDEAIENHISGFARLTSLAEIKQAIYEHGALQVTLPVLRKFDYVGANGLVMPPDAGDNYNRGLHSVTAIGWDDDMVPGHTVIEIMNHWGNSWGNNGFGFIVDNYDPINPYNPFSNDAWAIVDFIDSALTSGAPVGIQYPLDNPRQTQGFGDNPAFYAQFHMNGHNGLDFGTPKGTPVKSCDDGVVIFNGLRGGYGNAILIQHSWGTSIYAHLSEFDVTDGSNGAQPTQVKKGQVIGKSGGRPGDIGAGISTGEHLHFGIRINGVKNPGFFDWVDPAPYLRKATMTNSFFFRQGNTFGIGHPATSPDAIISDSLNSGLQVPLKAGVPDTAPASDRIDWAALTAQSYQVNPAPGQAELPDTTGIPDAHKV